eukprot:6080189-Alexandrium_andersonii.AAC.1
MGGEVRGPRQPLGTDGRPRVPDQQVLAHQQDWPRQPPEAPHRLGPPALPRERAGPPGRAHCTPEDL